MLCAGNDSNQVHISFGEAEIIILSSPFIVYV